MQESNKKYPSLGRIPPSLRKKIIRGEKTVLGQRIDNKNNGRKKKFVEILKCACSYVIPELQRIPYSLKTVITVTSL